MKFNFRKVASVVASALMLGSTAGFALAANYPAPFVVNGVADAAIIVGSNAPLDSGAATAIQSNLNSKVTTNIGEISVGEGDKYPIERAATKFSIGKGILDVVSGTITSDDLGTILKDGEYLDDDNDAFEYTQKIQLTNLTLSLFEDSDYKSDVPTVGIRVPSGTTILNYTLEFSTNPEWADLTNTDIEIMGKDYFISSVTTNTTINLLDAANTILINEGETKTVTVGGKTYTISIATLSGAASNPEVKLSVNGELTNSLREGQTYKLLDKTYIGIKDIAMRDVAGTIASVEFSIGSGKIELRHGLPVKVNDVTMNDLTAYFTNSGAGLNKIVLEWKADEDVFATEDQALTMPVFENVKIIFNGMHYPANEEIKVEKGSNTYIRLKSFPLKDGNADIDLMYGNGTVWQGTGREAGKGLLTANSTTTTITFDSDLHQYFVASYDDGLNKESYLMRATNFGVKSDGTTNTTSIQYYKDGSWVDKKAEAVQGDTVNLGSVSLTIGAIDRNGKSVVINSGTNVYFDRLFSKEGLKVYLPIAKDAANYTATPVKWPEFQANATADGYTAVTSYQLGFREEDKTGSTTAGKQFNVTLGWTSDKATVSGIVGETPDGGLEIEDTDVFRSFIYGELATELLHDTSGDQDSLKIIYHGDESYGKVYVTEAKAVSTTSGASSVQIIKDTDTIPTDKNLIVVGGSCVNSLAAKILNVAYPSCGESSTIQKDKYVIKVVAANSVVTGAQSGKIAVLVAGWEAADTRKAADKLLEGISTDVGAPPLIGPATGA
ncbi:MAG: hypothetical protein QW117_02550 [Candidatus Pacearchaeota archaeon]